MAEHLPPRDTCEEGLKLRNEISPVRGGISVARRMSAGTRHSNKDQAQEGRHKFSINYVAPPGLMIFSQLFPGLTPWAINIPPLTGLGAGYEFSSAPSASFSSVSSAFLSGRMCGKRITSRIECLPVSSMTRRSMPMPIPAAGGIP